MIARQLKYLTPNLHIQVVHFPCVNLPVLGKREAGPPQIIRSKRHTMNVQAFYSEVFNKPAQSDSFDVKGYKINPP
jgi:hypothetical protein